MDILNADLALSIEMNAWYKARGAPARTPRKTNGKATDNSPGKPTGKPTGKATGEEATRKVTGKRKRKSANDEDSAFHFIAFVPINGAVWRLDGIQSHPVNLGQLDCPAHVALLELVRLTEYREIRQGLDVCCNEQHS